MKISDIKGTGLLKDFSSPGHWYTSYPSLNHWTEGFRNKQYEYSLLSFVGSENKPLQLYLHIPFCAKLCHYCLCNVIISNNREKIQFFLDHLLREIDLLREFYSSHALVPNIREIHFGGGTPSHLDQVQFSQLCEKLNTLVDLKSLDEVAMEIDPRTVTQDDLRHYAREGVTRISFGIQDFDHKVQEAINRIQPSEMIDALLTPEIRALFKGVNFDLLYGLPFQTHETLSNTIGKVKEFGPERITLLKYCHAPEVRRHMKLIKEKDLPSPDELPVMFVDITQSFLDAGYEWVGLDHFAKSSDDLARAARNGGVGRTFNGFTPGRTLDLIGIGPTTTAAFGRTYAQAHYDLNDYYNSVNKGEFPILRGYRLTEDDAIRREVIFSLLCRQWVDFNEIGEKYRIDALRYFSRELKLLDPRLCTMEDGALIVRRWGRIMLRQICSIFDNKDVAPEHMKIAQKTITRRAVLA